MNSQSRHSSQKSHSRRGKKPDFAIGTALASGGVSLNGVAQVAPLSSGMYFEAAHVIFNVFVRLGSSMLP